MQVFKDFFGGISDTDTDEEIGKKVRKVAYKFRDQEMKRRKQEKKSRKYEKESDDSIEETSKFKKRKSEKQKKESNEKRENETTKSILKTPTIKKERESMPTETKIDENKKMIFRSKKHNEIRSIL